MKSMTGYGRGNFFASENFTINAELKTVNNRFLDVHLRTFRTNCSRLENDLKKQ